MPCSDLFGGWIRGLLVDSNAAGEDDEVVEIDPTLRIFDGGGGVIKGRFAGDTQDFIVNCDDTGKKMKVSFTRRHADLLTTTEYKGKVVPFGDRARVGIIKGKFDRRRFAADGKTQTQVASGDWETERPT